MQPSFRNSIALAWNNHTRCFDERPLKDLSWSLSDAATLYGALLVERFRSYEGKFLDLSDHKKRMLKGASPFAIEVPSAIADMPANASRLLELNQNVAQQVGDVGIAILLSPGETSDDTVALGTRPTCIMHLIELPYSRLAKWYTEGADLCLGQNHVVPSSCWPNEIKSRSRLPYFLADSVTKRNQLDSLAVLTTTQGFVSDTSVANLLIVDERGHFISPRKEDILVGCTLRAVERLLQKCDTAIQFRDIEPNEIASASEVLLTGSTGGVWFANTFGGRRIGPGNDRTQFQKLAQLWREHVGMDYVAQSIVRATRNLI
jgi:branched-chain amino acid aminotransferase